MTLTFQNVEAPPPDSTAAQLETEFIDFERKADELIESGLEFFTDLLQDETARKTIGVIILSVKYMLEDQSCSIIMMSISQQVKDTLIDGEKGALSVMYITDGVVELLTNGLIEETFEALLTSCRDIMHMPETPIVIDQIFEVIIEISKVDRGSDLVQSVENGILGIARRPKPREYVSKGFSNLRSLMVTQTRDKVLNFMSG